MRAFGGFAVICAIALAARNASASPNDVFGFGSRSSALGGAVSANVRDFSSNYYNPSGLVLARGMDLSIGYMYASHRLELNGHDSQVDPVRGIVGGVAAPGRIGPLPFAFGLGVHVNDDRLSRARTIKQEEPRWVIYDNRSQLLHLSANLALRPVDWLALGGGITFLAATRGSFGITGTAELPSSPSAPTQYDSQLRHEVDADLTAVRYPQAGITLFPDERISFGLVYRHQVKVELEVNADLRGTVDAQFIQAPAEYTLESRTVNAFIPRQVVAGTSAEPIERLRVGVDVTWLEWSAYESPVSRSKTTLDVDTGGLPLDLPPNPKPTQVSPPGFANRLVPRVGVEYRLGVTEQLDVPLRTGYVYEHSPVPPQPGRTNYVDADRHVLSVGSGFVWHEPGAVLPGDLRFDTHVQYSILPERVTRKESPADYVGDYRASGSILAVGATLSLGFR